MMLSRFFLNGASRDVHRCIADSHHLHARVLSMFDDAGGAPARDRFGVLHRLEVSERQGRIMLLVQSRQPPDTAKLPAAFLDPAAGTDAASTTSLAPLLAAIVPAARLRFRLRANPTKKIATKTGSDGVRRNGRRVPLHGDDERRAWLVRKLDDGGLLVVEEGGELLLRQRPDGVTRGRGSGRVATHEAHVFDGVAVVVDATKVRDALERGVGPGKAFGFGLLSLAPG
jgi:CRISPR system Cascade subunit CasE